MTKQKNVLKELIILALPIIFSNIISATTGLISMLFVAKINSDALASGAIITSTYGLIMMMAISIFYSISILIGHHKGVGRNSEIGKITCSGVALSCFIGLPLIFLFLYIEPILQLLHQPLVVSKMTGEYFHGLAYGLLPSLIVAVFSQFFMGIARTNIILEFTIIGVILNSFISYFLIFGYGAIPPLGIYGAGLANSITSTLQLVMILTYILRNPDFHQYNILPASLFVLTHCKSLLKIGAPISIQYTTEILAFSSITYLMGTIGIEALAAHQITLQSTMLALMIVMGISQSGLILISHNMNKDSKFDRTVICRLTLLIGVISMLIMGISYLLFSDALISVYVDTLNPSFHQIAHLAKNLLILAAVTQILDAARNISSGRLRGSGDTKTSMWTGLVSCWIIGIPMAIILAFIFHLNAIGLRLGMMLGILYGCIQLINRLVKMNRTDFSTQTIATGSI